MYRLRVGAKALIGAGGATGAAVFAALMALAAGTEAQTLGPGIPRVTFTQAEVGTRIARFSGLTERVPKAQMFQGYLVIFSNRCKRIDVIDIGDLKAPKTMKTFTFDGSGDDHTTPSAGTRIMNGGTLLDLADPINPRVIGTNAGFYGSVWPAFQWPYFYSTRSYDEGGRSSALNIVDYSAGGAGRRVASVGVQGQVGFTTGSTQVIGNLLIVTSGDEFAGVSTWDLRNPTAPTLLDVVKTGPGMYTSQMYGYHLVTSGPQNLGSVGFFDIRDPMAIKLDWQEAIPGNGDYAGFQNGFLFGGAINSGRWVKYDIKERKVVLNGTVPGRTTSRYLYPMGNMVWIGDAGRDGMNGSNNMSELFAHQANPDSIPPTVLYNNPANGAPNQAVTSRIGIVFDEEVDNRTLTSAQIEVRPRGGPPIAGTYGHTMGVVNFTPSAQLLPNTTYEVVVKSGGVKDWTGNGTPCDFTFKFSTGASVEGGPATGNERCPNAVHTRTEYKPFTRLAGEWISESGLRIRLQGEVPRGMARIGRLTIADMNGRVRVDTKLETADLAKGWTLEERGASSLPRGFYRLRLEAGKARLQGSVAVTRAR